MTNKYLELAKWHHLAIAYHGSTKALKSHTNLTAVRNSNCAFGIECCLKYMIEIEDSDFDQNKGHDLEYLFGRINHSTQGTLAGAFEYVMKESGYDIDFWEGINNHKGAYLKWRYFTNLDLTDPQKFDDSFDKVFMMNLLDQLVLIVEHLHKTWADLQKQKTKQ